MSLPTNSAQFRAAGTLLILGFVSEETLGYGSILSRCYCNNEGQENEWNWGMTCQTVC